MHVLLILSAVLAVTLAFPEEKYTTKYDNVNLYDLLHNDRLLLKAVACLLNEGGCTPDMAELKKVMPDALKTECSKCSEKQKLGAKTVLKYLIENKPDYFKSLEKKYDSEGTYRTKYSKIAEKEGIKL